MIKMYGIESTPYKFPKLLTPRVIVLEYVRQLVEIDEIHFREIQKERKVEFSHSCGILCCNWKKECQRGHKSDGKIEFSKTFGP